MNKKKHLSYSQINTFNNCPQKYKIIYIDKIKNNYESIEGFLGKVVHETLEWIYKEKLDYYIWDNIEDKYIEIWNNRWHNKIFLATMKMQYSKEYFKRLGLEYLRNYYKNNGGPHIKHNSVSGIEVPVEVKIGPYNFKGIVDRIDIEDNCINIHDYKTGKPKTEKQLLTDFQLVIYLLALKENMNDISNRIILNWHFLKEKSKEKQHIIIKHSEDEISNLKQSIIKQVQKIEKAIAKNDFSPKPSFLCHWCYYWKECEEKKIYNEINPSINLD